MKDLLFKLLVEYGELALAVLIGALIRWWEKSRLKAKIKELQNKLKDFSDMG